MLFLSYFIFIFVGINAKELLINNNLTTCYKTYTGRSHLSVDVKLKKGLPLQIVGCWGNRLTKSEDLQLQYIQTNKFTDYDVFLKDINSTIVSRLKEKNGIIVKNKTPKPLYLVFLKTEKQCIKDCVKIFMSQRINPEYKMSHHQLMDSKLGLLFPEMVRYYERKGFIDEVLSRGFDGFGFYDPFTLNFEHCVINTNGYQNRLLGKEFELVSVDGQKNKFKCVDIKPREIKEEKKDDPNECRPIKTPYVPGFVRFASTKVECRKPIKDYRVNF